MNLPWCVLIFFCNVSKGFSLCFTFCRFMPCRLTNDCLINFPQKSEKNKNMWALYTTAVIAHVLVLSLTQNVTAKHDHAKCWASLFYYFTISPRQPYYNAVIKNNMKWCWLALFSFYFFRFWFCFYYTRGHISSWLTNRCWNDKFIVTEELITS